MNKLAYEQMHGTSDSVPGWGIDWPEQWRLLQKQDLGSHQIIGVNKSYSSSCKPPSCPVLSVVDVTVPRVPSAWTLSLTSPSPSPSESAQFPKLGNLQIDLPNHSWHQVFLSFLLASRALVQVLAFSCPDYGHSLLTASPNSNLHLFSSPPTILP